MSTERRQLCSLKVENPDDGPGKPVRVRISSAISDRARDTLAVDGWKLDAWNANPVTLWMHDPYTPPPSKGLRAWVEDGYLKSEAVFAPADKYPFAGTIEALVRGGFISATSVGFVSDDYKPNDNGGLDFKTQELREWSWVTIPCNPEALVEAKSAGVDVEPLREWAAKTLERLDGSGVWIPKAEADLVIKALGGTKTFSIPAPSASQENDMKTLTLVVQVPESKLDEAKSDVEKKIKNHGGTVVKASETADAANDDLASHIKSFGDMIKQHQKALDSQADHVKAMGGYCADLAKHVKALKDMADGDGDDKSATDAVNKGAGAHALSASQLKRVKAISKAASDMQAAHHGSQGASDGEPDGDEGDDQKPDADKAAAEAKRKALEEQVAALEKSIKDQKMRLTGKVS